MTDIYTSLSDCTVPHRSLYAQPYPAHSLTVKPGFTEHLAYLSMDHKDHSPTLSYHFWAILRNREVYVVECWIPYNSQCFDSARLGSQEERTMMILGASSRLRDARCDGVGVCQRSTCCHAVGGERDVE